jgi:hypothetical protein
MVGFETASSNQFALLKGGSGRQAGRANVLGIYAADGCLATLAKLRKRRKNACVWREFS